MSSHSPGPGDGRSRRRSSSNTSLGSFFSVEEGNPLHYSAAQQNQRIPRYQPSQGPHGADGAAVINGGAASPTFSRLSGYTASSAFGTPAQPQMPQAYQQLPIQTFPQFLHPPQAFDSQIGVQTQPMWTSLTWSTPEPQTQPLLSLGTGAQLVNIGQANLNQPYPLTQVPSPQAVRSIDPSIAMPGFTSTQRVPKSNSSSPTSHSDKSAQDETGTRVDGGSVLPQNLRGDPFRSAKVKTEMCRDYNKPGGCRFGDKCNYAHGEHQLKNQKLMDLAAAGLVDTEVYRTHVCVPWVATGACPFDQRCARLHDPRVNGTVPSWLPHAESMITTKAMEFTVDKLYHQQFSSVYSCSPICGFVPTVRWKADAKSTNVAWKEFYSFCCNMRGGQSFTQSVQPNSDKPFQISEIHRLAMALIMRKSRAAQAYTFSPTHSFCGELCMILQVKHFRLDTTIQGEGKLRIVEMTEKEINNSSSSSNTITAHAISFGPVGDTSCRPAAIWFNIDPHDLTLCTRQQTRKHKRSRHRLRCKRAEETKTAPSSPIPPFNCNQPIDDAAFDLITEMLTHRYRMLMLNSSTSPNEKQRRSLALKEEQLQRSFESQRRFWMTWYWPKKLGSNEINDETDVPDVHGAYNFVTYGSPGYAEDAILFGVDQRSGFMVEEEQVVSRRSRLVTGLIWRSFLMNLQLFSERGAVQVPNKDDKMPNHDHIIPTIRRNPILRRLSRGKKAVRHSSRSIPSLEVEFCSPDRVNISLDVLIRQWQDLQQEYEDKANPLRDSQQEKAIPPDPSRRKALITYSFDEAATSWRRTLPRYEEVGFSPLLN
mmetsp:Transcript_10842/g.17993  ORF Transcript_10842/g.17993 Transcript_10842/m.17993 type:complete len:819 (-) Transcript_10842:930-3386(-)